jgi:hypothetical protein
MQRSCHPPPPEVLMLSVGRQHMCSISGVSRRGQGRKPSQVGFMLFALFFVAACAPRAHNKSHELLLHSSEDVRQANFTRFMSDQSCGAVTRTFFQGLDDADDMAFWNVSCANGTSYVVTIATDDSTRVLDCKRYEESGLQRCFVTFEERWAEMTRPKRSPVVELPAGALRK